VREVSSKANGALRYGNGQIYTQTLNARLLPERTRSVKGATTAFDQQLSYDARGKITAITDRAVAGNNRSYGYDGLGQLTSASGPWGVGSTRTVAYDARGNVTTLGSMGFIYDYTDQPVNVSGSANGVNGASGATLGNYTYDGNLKRVKSVVNGKTIYNVYDAGGALVHVHELSGNAKTDYVSGPTGALARIKNNAVTYLHPDHLGSAQSGTTASGAVAWRERYTPFGEEIVGAAANDNQAGFTGHIKDAATGLNYMQARYYDPVIGRFLSVDPVTFMDNGHPANFNRYAYGLNDPVNLTDPTGTCVERITCPDPSPITSSTTTINTTTNPSGSQTDTRTTTHISSDLSNVRVEQQGSIERLTQSTLGNQPATVTSSMQTNLLDLSEDVGNTVQVHNGVRTQAQQNSLQGNNPNTVASTSQHTVGDAADISVQRMSGINVSRAAVNSGDFERVNLYPSGAVHVDQRNVGTGTQFYRNWKRRGPP